MADLLVLRALFVIVLGVTGYVYRPFDATAAAGAGIGLLAGAGVILLELRARHMSLQRWLGALVGGIASVLIAYLASLVISLAAPQNTATAPFLQIVLLVFFGYFGIVVGGAKGESLDLPVLGGVVKNDKRNGAVLKVLDTSVIIDGRIADIAETAFVDGPIAIPQFVLRELQLVADSSDSLKRTRGRRGLDVLQRLQKMPRLKIQILENDFPAIREVDDKLIELAKQIHCKIVTNDFNLNKVAQLHKVEVLNINDLANALRPVVLPGETMRVFILKEGKEANQGIAYLDDGTMVVVDNARRMISKTVDIGVTSVLQTAAGKMIFGRFDERQHAVYERESRPTSREQVSAGS